MRTEGTYTDGGTPNSFEKVYLPGHAIARLGRFVNSTKLAGNDEQYAATLALVGQRLGIPSRVVMGADPAADGSVRGRDVHAWVEVQLDDGSWFPLAASTFVPSRDKTPSEQQLKTEEQKVGAQVPPPAGVNPPSLLQGPDQAQNATDITKRKKSPFDVLAWPLWLRVLVLGIARPAAVWPRRTSRSCAGSRSAADAGTRGPGRCPPGPPRCGATSSPRRARWGCAVPGAGDPPRAGRRVRPRGRGGRARGPRPTPSCSAPATAPRTPAWSTSPRPTRCAPPCAHARAAGCGCAPTPTPGRSSPGPTAVAGARPGWWRWLRWLPGIRRDAGTPTPA